jgi:two-component system alkaline phosphatase synthesis response regulator PhoP
MKLQAGPLRLVDHRLYIGDDSASIKLFPKEAHLLAVLMQHPGQVVSRATLMREVWQTEYLGDTRTLDVHICWLRQKLEEDPSHPQLLLTQRGVGYELNVPEAVR